MANMLFGEGLEETVDETSLFTEDVDSDGESETYAWVRNFIDLQEWIGQRKVQSLSASTYTLVNKDYEGTVGIPVKALKRDRIGIYKNAFRMLGRAAARHRPTKIWELFALGETAKGHDDVSFFNATHPGENGQAAWSNFVAGGGAAWYLLDLSKIIKPFIAQIEQEPQLVAKDRPTDDNVFFNRELLYGVDYSAAFGYTLPQLARASKATLDAAALNAGIQAMMELKGDTGKPLGIMPTHLVVGPSNRAVAKTIIEAERNADGSTNTNFRALDLMVSAHLA